MKRSLLTFECVCMLATVGLMLDGNAALAAIERDVIVYGSTPAALTAAIEAKEMGRSVVIVSPETRIGGLTTGGLGQTDIGNKSAFGGLALQFYRDIARHYVDDAHWTRQRAEDYFPDGQCAGSRGRDSMWTFEPSAALEVLGEWERRYGLEIHRGKRLDRSARKVRVEDGQRKIVSFMTTAGDEYRGKVFVDATYEGDLMAAAGVSYTVGREGNSVYGETLNGCQPRQGWHRFCDRISPYVKADDPSSGLLPGIEKGPIEPEGTGDRRVQAYCFRMCLTDDPENRIPFARPEGYDERLYELLLRNLEAQEDPVRRAQAESVLSAGIPWINSRMPNRKTDTNNCMGQSTDFVGQSYDWAEASYEERERILRAHLDYQRGLMWTLANHPRVPAYVREEVSKWGTCKDEFQDGPGDGWQRQLYVREARRMVGETVMTEHHCRGELVAVRPIAMAAYNMDSHHVRRYVDAGGSVRNEGDVEIGGIQPYPIDYGAIVPRRGECANLLVPVCLSASHIAFGSIRMEPVFFALGQAAGAAAAFAVEQEAAVQDVDYRRLRQRLLADGQVLAAAGTFDPFVPVCYRPVGLEPTIRTLRQVRATTGLRRFFLTGPGFNDVMFRPFPDDLYAGIGRDVEAVQKALADTDVEIGWWCAPSIRYVSDFPSVEDSCGRTSKDNKKCPLDPAFAADFAAKIRAVAEKHPAIINIEDDFTLAWGRGLDTAGACFCPRHLVEFAKRYGKPLTGPEIVAAFKDRTADNLAIRRAFAETVRESLVALARHVRASVDEVDPSIRIMLCQPGGSDMDGDSTEAVARAFAGSTRPAVRPWGALYSAETTPASIPPAVAHAVWTLERLPKDIETFYEADTYPHNRCFSSASQLLSLMTGAAMAGSSDFLFYCLQYVDDPLEDRGYVDAYRELKPRLDAVRRFIRDRRARLEGVREVWTAEDLFLTRGFGEGRGSASLSAASYLLAKFGIPYTTRSDASGTTMLVGGVAEVLGGEEIRRLLSGGVFVDAQAAEILAQRGFSRELGVDVTPVERLPALGEEILPAADCRCAGRQMNAYFAFPAGAEGSVRRFVKLTPHEGTETLCRYTGLDASLPAPSITFATNSLGGRVAVMATSVIGNRTSGLYNLRKQELVRNLLERLSPGSTPVVVKGSPGIWVLANVSANGREMLVMVNNLSGDERDGVRLGFSAAWMGADVARLAEDGTERFLGKATDGWRIPFVLGQMKPEFFVVRQSPKDRE